MPELPAVLSGAAAFLVSVPGVSPRLVQPRGTPGALTGTSDGRRFQVGSFLLGHETGHSIARPTTCGGRVPPSGRSSEKLPTRNLHQLSFIQKVPLLCSSRGTSSLTFYQKGNAFSAELTGQRQQPSARPRGRCSPTSRPDPRGPCGRKQRACGRWAYAGQGHG